MAIHKTIDNKPQLKTIKAAQPSKNAVVKKIAPKVSAVTYPIGSTVSFVGYKDMLENPLFTKGAILTVVDLSKENNTNEDLRVCVLESDLDAYKINADSVNAEALYLSEISDKVSNSKSTEVKPIAKKAVSTVIINRVGAFDEIVAANGNNIIQASKSILSNIHESFFYLGGLLAEIKATHAYEEAGYVGANGWVDFLTNEFSFAETKARDLIDIYQTFSTIPDFNPESISAIGWTKARELARFVTKDNFDEIISLASTDTTVRELQATLKSHYTEDGSLTPSGRKLVANGNKVLRHEFKFVLHEDSGIAVADYIQMAKKTTGIDDDSQLFEYIITEWAQENLKPSSSHNKTA